MPAVERLVTNGQPGVARGEKPSVQWGTAPTRLIACLVAAFLPVLARATCQHAELKAVIQLPHIVGSIECNSSIIRVATYPRILRTPAGLNDVNRFWFYPDGFDSADMELWLDDGTVLSGDGALQALEPATRTLRFRTRVPRRNGTFGRRGGVTYLLGGWHPAFVDHTTTFRYEITLPPGMAALIGDRTVAAQPTSQIIRGVVRGTFVPVVLAPNLRVRGVGAARIVIPENRRASSSREEPAWHLREIGTGDNRMLAELASTLRAGASALAALGIAEARTTVVIAPLQENLAESFDGGFALAERAFHLLPFERFYKFHRARIWRAQLQSLVMGHLAARDESLPLAIVADAAASALRDRLILTTYGHAESAADLLDGYAIIPEIDALVFAPQVPFQDAYYEAVDETPSVRRQIDDFGLHARPRGKLLYEKLVDHLGPDAAYDLLARYLVGSWRFSDVVPADVVLPWLGPHPQVDYSLAAVATRDGNATVSVAAAGPDAGRLREPIAVQVTDTSDHVHNARRIGPGDVVLPVHGAIETVELDPDHRLVEHARSNGVDARFNNRQPARWRFLLNNITGLLSVTDGELTASADFTLRRIHDLRNEFDFFLAYSASSLGLGAGISYAFGGEITPLRLGHTLGLAAAYERLRPESATIAAGDQGSLTLYYHHDTRLSAYSSFEGQGWQASAVGAYGVDIEQTHYRFAQLGAGAFKLVPVATGHALLGRVRGDLQIGSAPPQNGLRLGGRYRGARGFEADEVRGDRRIVLSGEYRHLLEGDGHADFWGLLTFTRIEGAAFADAVYLPVDRGGCAQDLFYDVGYGLRFFGDILNVSPATLQVDVGIPLQRCPDETHRTPVTVYIALLQSFASF